MEAEAAIQILQPQDSLWIKLAMDSIAPCEVASDKYCTETGAEGQSSLYSLLHAPQYEFDALWTMILAINKKFL